MTNIVSSIKPEGRDNAEKPIVDDKQIWTSREMNKKSILRARIHFLWL
jgi:hypothetical protein